MSSRRVALTFAARHWWVEAGARRADAGLAGIGGFAVAARLIAAGGPVCLVLRDERVHADSVARALIPADRADRRRIVRAAKRADVLLAGVVARGGNAGARQDAAVALRSVPALTLAELVQVISSSFWDQVSQW